jgi:hypothetical protein
VTLDDLSVVRGGTAIRMIREGISDTYSRIPLHLMIRFAIESACEFDLKRLDENYRIPPDLEKIKAIIEEKISSGRAQSPEDWLDDEDDEVKRIRLKYLHFSARYGEILGAHDPQWVNGGIRDGQRGRVIQDG